MLGFNSKYLGPLLALVATAHAQADKYDDKQLLNVEYVAVESALEPRPNLPAGTSLVGKYSIIEEFDGTQYIILSQTIRIPYLKNLSYY